LPFPLLHPLSFLFAFPSPPCSGVCWVGESRLVSVRSPSFALCRSLHFSPRNRQSGTSLPFPPLEVHRRARARINDIPFPVRGADPISVFPSAVRSHSTNRARRSRSPLDACKRSPIWSTTGTRCRWTSKNGGRRSAVAFVVPRHWHIHPFPPVWKSRYGPPLPILPDISAVSTGEIRAMSVLPSPVVVPRPHIQPGSRHWKPQPSACLEYPIEPRAFEGLKDREVHLAVAVVFPATVKFARSRITKATPAYFTEIFAGKQPDHLTVGNGRRLQCPPCLAVEVQRRWFSRGGGSNLSGRLPVVVPRNRHDQDVWTRSSTEEPLWSLTPRRFPLPTGRSRPARPAPADGRPAVPSDPYS